MRDENIVIMGLFYEDLDSLRFQHGPKVEDFLLAWLHDKYQLLRLSYLII